MSEQLAGFPFWIVEFDEHGSLVDQQAAGDVLTAISDEALTDLFVFTHGWNNSRTIALNRYRAFFTEVQTLVADADLTRGREAKIGVIGVIWPSMRWADEDESTAVVDDDEGGAAAFSPVPETDDAALVENLKPVFPRPEQQEALEELAALMEARPEDPAELARFQTLMETLVEDDDAAETPEDNGEASLIVDDSTAVFERLATVAVRRPAEEEEGGAAGLLDDRLDRLWDGAKEALRGVTYWEMKKRAGIVGSNGVGPFLGRLHDAHPALRIHLIGHSFGARAVSFALKGLPLAQSDASPVKSVLLLQGAFSHFAFAKKLPHDQARGGALAGMAARVDGPLLVTHTKHDRAVGRPYALASMPTGEDAAAFDEILFRWGAMGHDGAQAVEAAKVTLGPLGTSYSFQPGAVFNLDGDEVIKTMLSRINGAHSDIIHEEIAWALLCAAGILTAEDSS
jgi:hypothetical protein